MRDQTVVWTPLPNGRGSDGSLRMSVHVAPRLRTDEGGASPTLGLFPDFVDWPRTLRGGAGGMQLRLDVQFGDGSVRPATVVSAAPDSDTWKALFDTATGVASWRFDDLSRRAIRSFPTQQVYDFLREFYTGVVASAITDYPPVGQILAALAPIAPGRLGPRIRDLQTLGSTSRPPQSRYTVTNPVRFDPAADSDQVSSAFAQLRVFYGRPAYTPDIPASGGSPAARGYQPPVPTLDFHRAVAALGDYPGLLRALGLVLDVTIANPPALGDTTVRVLPSYARSFPKRSPGSSAPASSSYDVRPFVLARLGSGRFEPLSSDGSLADGFLRLEQQDVFRVVEVDVDGAALKNLDFQPALTGAEAKRTADTPTDASTHALRTGGLSVSRLNAAPTLQQLVSRFTAAQAAAGKASTDPSSTDPVFSAEDLVRGYRIDVMDISSGVPTPQFRSVHARSGTFRLTRTGRTLTFGDEGWSSLGVTSAAGTPSPVKNDLYQHESLFRWDGWSLSAPRPGKALSPEPHPTGDPGHDLVGGGQHPADNPPATQIPLGVTFRPAPGTLPSLRYGHTYRLRARVVDLAGNSRPQPGSGGSGPDTDTTHATAARRFTRFDPVPAPTLVPDAPLDVPGESVERLVVRSDPGSPAPPPRNRHVGPPKSAELQAERHGQFDGADGVPKPSLYATIADYDARTLLSGGTEDPTDPATPKRHYYPGAAFEVPFLPDVLGRGATFAFDAGVPGGATVQSAHFADLPYPRRRTFLLRLQEGDAPPALVTDSGGTVTRLVVSLPKGRVATARFSSLLADADVDLLGMWQWLADRGRQTSAIRGFARAGRAWAFTPYRTMTFVHAVRQPLVAPRFGSPAAFRNDGSTSAVLFDTGMTVDDPSTGRLELSSAWTEVSDPLGLPGPQRTPALGPPVPVLTSQLFLAGRGPAATPDGRAAPPALLAHAAQATPSAAGDAPAVLRYAQQEYGDTRYRQVSCTLTATSAFTDYYPETKQVSSSPGSPVGLDARGVEPTTEQVVDAADPSTPLVREQKDGGGTVLRAGQYRMNYPAGTIEATDHGRTLRVTFLPTVSRPSTEPAAAGETITPAQQTASIAVPSTARPAAPDVAYIVPAYQVQPITKAGDTTTAGRLGGALRVYLRRPWYSSGDGELLGVLLRQEPDDVFSAGSSDPAPDWPDPLDPVTTRIGADPVFVSGRPVRYPVQSHFLAATARSSGRRLVELTGLTDPSTGSDFVVDVAGHEVGYDEQRRLWYADVIVRTPRRVVRLNRGFRVLPEQQLPSYEPFIRLALARFQPQSLDGVELSRVRLAQFAQLAPDRSVTVVTSSDGSRATVTVVGTGPTGSALSQRIPSTITARSQRQTLSGVDPELGWTDTSDPVRRRPTASGDTSPWTGQVGLPPAGPPRRVLLSEYELVAVGQTSVFDTDAGRGRLIFTEAVPL